MNKTIGLIITGVIVIFLLFGVGSYNGLVGKEEAVNSTWAKVDTQLTRRADLIPNLVQTVKGYAKHESKIFEDIAKARAAMMGARSPEEKLGANDQLNSALGRLFVVAENYPNLKANEQFQSLMDSLEGSENRISLARNNYNESVQDYNKSLRTFPTNIIGSITGFESKKYFAATESEKKNPKVDFE